MGQRVSDPYAGPLAAVTSWGVTTGPTAPETAASGQPGGTGGAAAEDGVGVYDPNRGALVATFPATGYARWLDWLSVKCSYSGLVEVFAGSIDDLGRITSYGDGSVAEFDPNHPRYIPQGAPLFVVWYVPPAGHTATCKAGFRQAV